MAGLAPAANDDGISIVIEDEDTGVRRDPETGNVEIPQGDGGVVIQFNRPGDGDEDPKDDDPENFYRNLADGMDDLKLQTIANDLLEAIAADDSSRAQWLANRQKGMDILGIQLKEPQTSSAGDSSNALDGLSTVTNPLLLEACLKGWANAQAELLPAAGPCKVEDIGSEETEENTQLSEALERGMNAYLTTVAKEYYPDTQKMLLWGVYFSGSGFKKLYRCPLKRRPVSISVDPKDFIVSDTATDLASCERITHQIAMRRSVMLRMMKAGAYVKITLGQPSPTANVVDEKVAAIQGTRALPERPEDQPYTVYEVQCELDLNEFAPSDFKDTGIALPYLVTIEKDSQMVLAIRRDWKPDDEQAERKKMYVRYPYVPGPGFYGTGLLNILGNASAAMTAAWRESLDAGMMANFPGFLIAKSATRQNTSDMRVGLGQGTAIDTQGKPIGDMVANLPYHDVTPGLMQLIDKITSQAKEAAGQPDIPVGEGTANIPVGTMLALIEQSTHVMAASHKGQHTAQSEELEILLDLFREDPESFWRWNKKTKRENWDEAKLLAAIETCTLVPKSDPNIPSHLHRVMKAVALIQISQIPHFASRLNMGELLLRVMRAMREDPNGLVQEPPPSDGKPNPEQVKADAAMISAQNKGKEIEQRAGKLQLEAQQLDQKERTQDKDHQADASIASVDLAKELVQQQSESQRADQKHHVELQTAAAKAKTESVKAQSAVQKGVMEVQKHKLDVAAQTHQAGLSMRKQDLAEQQHANQTGLAAAKLNLDAFTATKPDPAPKKKK
jgi:hypothetical protein